MAENVPFMGPGGISNEFVNAMLNSDKFGEALSRRIGALTKADTISQATNLVYYDLSPVVQMLYPYLDLIPRIGKLPRVKGIGGTSYHWKRVVNINSTNQSPGISEGNRGARIPIATQDMMAAYRTLGHEASVTFEARDSEGPLTTSSLAIATNSALRALRINEEKILINGNAGFPLGVTPTPVLTAGAVAGYTGSFSNGNVYVVCVALSGMVLNNYTSYNAATGLNGIPGQLTKINVDGSVDTYGGGSAQPSAETFTTTSGTNVVTATVTPVLGAAAYAWFVGTATGAEYLAGLTPSNQVYLTKFPSITTAQPLTSLKVGGNYQDNSTNNIIPDGVLTQIYGAILGPDPGRNMATNPILPTGISISQGGSILYVMPTQNTGLTLSGINLKEVDVVLQAAYDQYKIGFDRILVSSIDMLSSFGAMLNTLGSGSPFRIEIDRDGDDKIVAGRTVTAYKNKFFGNTLQLEIHPYLPAGTMIFWSDRSPAEISGVANIVEAHVLQDYFQIQWPWHTRRHEIGCYVREVFPIYFTPAFAAITNINPSSGNLAY